VFEPHVDGARLASINSQSFLTVNIYLNTVQAEAGGSTRVLRPPTNNDETTQQEEDDVEKPQVLGKIHPLLGTASIFRDTLYHDGEELLEGVKFLLRTDVLFTRDEDFQESRVWKGLSDGEKAARAVRLAERLEDAGNYKEAVEWYRRGERLGGG
jgi:hypothetical protein